MIIIFSDCADEVLLSEISVPPIHKRGRPKGSETTVIGLPRKKYKVVVQKLLPFVKLSTNYKKESMFFDCVLACC